VLFFCLILDDFSREQAGEGEIAAEQANALLYQVISVARSRRFGTAGLWREFSYTSFREASLREDIHFVCFVISYPLSRLCYIVKFKPLLSDVLPFEIAYVVRD